MGGSGDEMGENYYVCQEGVGKVCACGEGVGKMCTCVWRGSREDVGKVCMCREQEQL